MRRLISILLFVWLCAALLCGCGRDGGEDMASGPSVSTAEEDASAPAGMTFRQAAPTPTREATATPDPEALQEYAVEGVGLFWLPAGFDMAVEALSDPIPARSVTFTKENVTIRAVLYGADSFQAAGESMPAALEDFAAWDMVRRDMPEAAAFNTDEFGDLFADWIESDGLTVYYVPKAGTDSYAVLAGYAPEGDEAVAQIPLWFSKVTLG